MKIIDDWQSFSCSTQVTQRIHVQNKQKNHLTKSATAVAMPRALINANRFHRHFTKSARKTIIFAVTFFFNFRLASICFSWVHVTPTWYATIGCEDILVNFCPIHYSGTIRFGRWTETDERSETWIIHIDKVCQWNSMLGNRFYILKLKPTCLC